MEKTTPPEVIRLLSRRKLITLGLGAAAGIVVLPGCGGSTSHGSSGPHGRFVSVEGTVTLPSGLAPDGLLFISGGTESAVKGSLKVRVLEGSPTLVSVLDKASSRVVLLGMIDPAAGPFSIDATNVAATLLFFAFGGTQLPEDDRKTLWITLLADGATATLAAVVSARLAVNPFALEEGDSDLLAAIQTAIQNSGAQPDRGRKLNGRAAPRPKARTTVTRPTPPVLLDLDSTHVSIANGSLGHGKVNDDVVPDLLSVTNLNPLDTVLYGYRENYVGGNVQSVSKLLGPTAVPGSRPSITEFGPIAINLDNPTDTIELISFVSLVPYFDAPDSPAFSNPAYAAETTVWRGELGDLWQRAVAQMAADIVYDALGWRQAELSTTALGTAVENLKQIGGTLPGMQGALTGTDFSGNVDVLTDFASHDVLSATTFLDAIKTLAPVVDTASAFRLAQMRGLLRIAKIGGLLNASATYGRIYALYVYNSSNDLVETARLLTGHSLKRLILENTASATTYTPGGGPVTFTLSDKGLDYLTTYADQIEYHWKVFGAGSSHISDGNKINTEFDTDKRVVTLTPSSDASGLLTVSVEAFSTAGGKHFSLGKVSASVNSAANDHLALSPADSHIVPGASGGWTVTYDGNSNPSGWPGIDASHLRFRWEIPSADFGKLGVSSGTGTSIETTTNQIAFFPNLNAQDREKVDLTVTVAVVDPSTGDFTNLAVLNGHAIVDVRNEVQFQIKSANFPLSDLRFPEEVRMLVNRSSTMNGSDEEGTYVGGTWSRAGSSTLDFLSLVVRSSDFAVDGQAPISTSRSGVTLACITGVPTFDARVVSGGAVVLESVRNGANQLTYLKLNGTATFAETGGRERTLTVDFTAGFGTPP